MTEFLKMSANFCNAS